jgi:hypothetical protein
MELNSIQKKQIDRCLLSSNRTRYVLIIIIIASVLVFVSFWNSSNWSWFNNRLEKTQKCINYKVWEEEDSLKINCLLQKNKLIEYREVKLYSDIRNLDSLSLHINKHELNKIKAEEINLTKIPFLGIILDVNDLSMIGGFSFVVMLLWLKFSLKREWLNLSIISEYTKGNESHNVCFDILAMQQVLTLPKDKYYNKRTFLRIVPYILFSLPFLVQGVILIYDISTFEFGKSINYSYTIVLYILGSLFLIAILVLIIQCFIRFHKINKYWK